MLAQDLEHTLADGSPGEWFWTLLNGEAAVVREISKAVSARGREFPK